ncbi:MAG: HAD family phosphatase [Nanoarchaeota archaeon]|nr:HAD family phosphatase [Nanoarchaeota archaeon]MBU1135242.1 HAD family phosphatase [Nanoarchaeota archaeon]MBU2519908.1 HAD family phosphatase [Nanoarchaeota archaeon]
MIKAIIFDLGGVILQNKVEDVIKKISERLNIDYDSLFYLYKKHKQNMSSGKMSAKQFADLIKTKFKLDTDVIQEWKKAYLETMPINEKMINIVKELKKNYKVAMVSNIPELHAQINKERGTFSYFNPTILSCEVHLTKPQKEIFKLTLRELKLNPKECVFIDDREENLSVPNEMGFYTVLFRNSEQLIKDLGKIGIKF